MGKTFDIADNLVKMAQKLKYGDISAKDKVIEYAEKLIPCAISAKTRLVWLSPRYAAQRGCVAGARLEEPLLALGPEGVRVVRRHRARRRHTAPARRGRAHRIPLATQRALSGECGR